MKVHYKVEMHCQNKTQNKAVLSWIYLAVRGSTSNDISLIMIQEDGDHYRGQWKEF